jgi:AcrR family transcriptional regulator
MSIVTKPSRADAVQITIDRLLAVARRAFAEQGFAATSLDALAAEAGVTRGALHHHFGNKAGLFEAVLRRLNAEICTLIEAEWSAEPDPWRAFRLWYDRYLDEALHPSRRRILFQDATAVLGLKAIDILLDEGIAEVVADLTELVAEGRVRPVDPEATAYLLNGAVANLAFWAADDSHPQDRVARAKRTLALLLDGLTAP